MQFLKRYLPLNQLNSMQQLMKPPVAVQTVTGTMEKSVHKLKPAMLLVVVQIVFAAANLLYKLAINDGMSFAIANACRFLFAASFTVPVALIFERKKKNRPKITWRVLFMAFLCGLFGGTLFQNLYLASLALTSTMFVTAIYNLIPAVTFILAISFGLERLNLRKASGKAKVLGTVIGIGGAMVMTFLKGVKINIWSIHTSALDSHHHGNGRTETLNTNNFGSLIWGVVYGLGSCFSCALWLIVQTKMSKEYPSDHASAALMSIMAALQCTIFALCIERDWSQWKLGWNVRLLNVAYSGVVASGIMVIVIAWCLRAIGPIYASAFNPLMLVLVAVASSLMLNENLYLGSVLGAVLVVCGLYMVLWGKGKELTPELSSQKTETVDISVVPPPVEDKIDNSTSKNSTCSCANDNEGPLKYGREEDDDVHDDDKKNVSD